MILTEIETEIEFKTQLIRCVRYMTKQGSDSLEMDMGKVRISLSIETLKPSPAKQDNEKEK